MFEKSWLQIAYLEMLEEARLWCKLYGTDPILYVNMYVDQFFLEFSAQGSKDYDVVYVHDL